MNFAVDGKSISLQTLNDLADPTRTVSSEHTGVQPLQDFIDEHQDLTVEEWNAIDPPPDVEGLQDGIVEELQAAANEGCEPAVLEKTLQIALERGRRGDAPHRSTGVELCFGPHTLHPHEGEYRGGGLAGAARGTSQRRGYSTTGSVAPFSTKAACRARTASSVYFSSTTTEILISLVEII